MRWMQTKSYWWQVWFLHRGIYRNKLWWMFAKCIWWQVWCMPTKLLWLSILSRRLPKLISRVFSTINCILPFQTANVILMVLQIWNVKKSMVIALAKWDLLELSVINVKGPFLIIRHVKVCTIHNTFLYVNLILLWQIANVILRVRWLWNVTAKVNALAERDTQE